MRLLLRVLALPGLSPLQNAGSAHALVQSLRRVMYRLKACWVIM